jgi:hypothetical protein
MSKHCAHRHLIATVLVGLDGVACSGLFGEIRRGPALEMLIARVA